MKPVQQGYYRFPAIHNDQIAFVCEDDLWLVNTTNSLVRRLTAQNGEISYPFFSDDGSRIAYISTEEGSAEVYLLDLYGGLPEKLTELSAKTTIAGWHDGKIIISTSYKQPFNAMAELYYLNPVDSSLEKIPCGPARNIAISKFGTVIGRNTADPARWKRYRGGTAGELWIDRKNNGTYSKLITLNGNTACPCWLDKRLYFISDHEECGNIYSVNANGSDLRKHTFLSDFYVRQATSDGKRTVFQAGGDLYLFDPRNKENKGIQKIEITYYSAFNQLKRRFVDAESYLEDYDLYPDGSRMLFNIRGKIFTMGNWEGAAVQHGLRDGVRYRQTRWLPDGYTLITASDEGGEYILELFDVQKQFPVKKYKIDIGIPQDLKVSPNGEMAALTNHRHELLLLNLKTSELIKIEQNKHGEIAGINWSPDSLWLAYASPVSLANTIIKIYGLEQKITRAVTEPVLLDSEPCFDPDGRYLYFLSNRIFNPVYDNLHFDLNFPKGMKPYLILLQKDALSPFNPEPRGYKESEDLEAPPKNSKAKDGKEEELPKIKIDLAGIEDRIVPFPVNEGIFENLVPAKDRIYYLAKPVIGALDKADDEPEVGSLRFFDLKELHEDLFIDGVEDFAISADSAAIFYKSEEGLRVLDINVDPKEPPKDEPTTARKEGWLDLERIKLSITPQPEWQQMFSEAWRLQREYFWQDDMSGIDWLAVYHRYQPLLKRVASRTEFSDLVWEMQGELGTSHAYEFGGDYREVPQYQSGFLGADFVYDDKHDAYKIVKICKGDLWQQQSPLKAPGLNIAEGSYLTSIGGQQLKKNLPPAKLLACQAAEKIEIGLADKNCKNLRFETVQTLKSEQPLRYRDWVEANRNFVHKKSRHKIGYLHVPDMDDQGYADFHRYFLNEFDYDGLIIDVRYNGGGHVSQLLLEKLSRKRLGCDLARWSVEQPYPAESAKGPMVVITNEHAGSDGDIFCHAFKMLKLGKLIGKRTWGGVVGVWPRNWLVDGTVTTQPEFSFWFKDIGHGVENYGTEPDIEVEITPEDYRNGIDTQLFKALEILSAEIKTQPVVKAEGGKKEKPKLGE